MKLLNKLMLVILAFATVQAQAETYLEGAAAFKTHSRNMSYAINQIKDMLCTRTGDDLSMFGSKVDYISKVATSQDIAKTLSEGIVLPGQMKSTFNMYNRLQISGENQHAYEFVNEYLGLKLEISLDDNGQINQLMYTQKVDGPSKTSWNPKATLSTYLAKVHCTR